MIKQYHLAKVNSNVVELNWDIFNMCNYDCTYCYMKDKPDDWLKIAKWEKQLDIIDAISTSKKPLAISLVGGEPTLYHKFNEFINRLDDALQSNGQHNILTVISNNTYPNKLTSIDSERAKRIKLNLSYHAEEVVDEIFLENLNKLIDHGFQEILITVLMHHDKRKWPMILNMSKTLSIMPVKVETAYLTRRRKFFNYGKGFDEVVNEMSSYVDQDKSYVFDYGDRVEYYGEYDLINPINNGETNFLDWDCYINRFNINIDCQISKSCVGDMVKITDILGEGDIEATTCPYDLCSYNCHLSFTKCKKSS